MRICMQVRRVNPRRRCFGCPVRDSFLLLACGNQGHPLISAPAVTVGSTLASEQVLNRHLEADPRTLDPGLLTDVVGQRVLDDLFEGLVTLDEAGATLRAWRLLGRPAPTEKPGRFNCAKTPGGPTASRSRRTISFMPGAAKWIPPQARSTPRRSRRSRTPWTPPREVPPSKLGVESAGPRTLVVHLHAPTAYLLALLTNAYLYPLYEPAVKQWGDAWTQPGHMVSNGPFLLSERVINGHITLDKNPYYWDAGHVRLTRVIYHTVADNNATTSQYLAGNLDFTDRFNVSETDRLQQILGDQVVLSTSYATAMFGYNLAKPPFQGNPKLRLALNMAVDREILMKYVERGVGVPAYNMLPPLEGFDPAVPDWAKLSPDERHALARKLYQEAGYSDSHPLETVITYASGGPERAASWKRFPPCG